MPQDPSPLNDQTPPEAPPTPEPKAKPISDEIRAKLLGFTATQAPAPAPSDEKPAEQAPAPKPEGKEVTPPEPSDPAQDQPPAEDPKPEEKPKKRQAAPKKIQAVLGDQPNTAEIVREAASAAAVAAVKATQQSASPAAAEPELPKDIARKLDYYRELEQLDPRHKGLTQKVIEFSKRGGVEDQYIRDWRKANPGQEFDSEAAEHEDFYAKVAPVYDEADLEEAKERVIERRAVERARKELEPRIQEQERARASREIEPVVDRAIQELANSALGSISEDLLNVAREKGSAGLEEADPLAAQVILDVLPKYEGVAETAVRVMSSATPYNEQNQTHRQIMKIAVDLENVINQVDPNQRWKPVYRGGRIVGHQAFATAEQYVAMTPAQQAQHWTVGADEVLAHISNLTKSEVKARYDRFSSAAKKKFGSVPAQPAAPAPAPAAPAKPTPAAPTVSSPSIGSSTPTPSPSAGKSNGDLEKATQVAKMMGFG